VSKQIFYGERLPYGELLAVRSWLQAARLLAATLLTKLSAALNSLWTDSSTLMWPSTNATPSLLRLGGMEYPSADSVGT